MAASPFHDIIVIIMFFDGNGAPVTPISTAHYSNTVSVRYEDGTTKDIPLSELRTTLNRVEFAKVMRETRIKKQ